MLFCLQVALFQIETEPLGIAAHGGSNLPFLSEFVFDMPCWRMADSDDDGASSEMEVEEGGDDDDASSSSECCCTCEVWGSNIPLFPTKNVLNSTWIHCQDLTAEQESFLEFGREFAEKGGCFTYFLFFLDLVSFPFTFTLYNLTISYHIWP